MDIRLARVCDSAITYQCKNIYHLKYSDIPVPNFLATDIFGTGIFH